jgi:multiple sugar transport system permease protein
MSVDKPLQPEGRAAVRPSSRGRRRRSRLAVLVPYLFLAPFILLFLTMLMLPMGYALWLSLFQERLVGGTIFVGLRNYQTALGDPNLWTGVRNVVLFGIVQVPLMLAIALMLALILDSALIRARSFFRAAFYLPYAVPTVIAALLWGYLYGQNFGPFSQLADAIGIARPRFLSDAWMLWSIGNIVTWEFTGYNMVILYAALQAVPRDLEEAASLDGAGPFAFAWHVKLPLILPALFLCAIFSIIGTFQLFNEPKIMQSLAPNVIGRAYTPNLYAYSLAFVSVQYNMAAAVSFITGLIVAILSYFFIRASARSGGVGQ